MHSSDAIGRVMYDIRMSYRCCSQNPDTDYNSCNVPQEMSNEAIDRELEGVSEVLQLDIMTRGCSEAVTLLDIWQSTSNAS